MDKIFENIIRQGWAIGKSYEEINAELKAAGADFHLSDLGDPGDPGEAGWTGWTEQEMKEGFIPAEKEPEDVKYLHDYMKFSKEKAGTEAVVSVPSGKYRITWDEDGHPVKAIRL